jgi:hypothetical protein
MGYSQAASVRDGGSIGPNPKLHMVVASLDELLGGFA